jgi:signal transduction histidine kinase
VVENLLRNAAEATSVQPAAVEVRLEGGDSVARIVVEDRGPGISEEVADQLFVPFSSTKPSGGLGLALARRFARLHGGDVRYEARPGGGARFTLELPLGRES